MIECLRCTFLVSLIPLIASAGCSRWRSPAGAPVVVVTVSMLPNVLLNREQWQGAICDFYFRQVSISGPRGM